MSPAVWTFLGLGLVSYAFKAAGPLLVGGRRMPPALDRFASLIPGPLLAALVMTSAIVADGRFVLDARVAGLAAAAIALWRGANFVVVVIVAAVVTAVVRAM